jgi:hypothetical protein
MRYLRTSSDLRKFEFPISRENHAEKRTMVVFLLSPNLYSVQVHLSPGSRRVSGPELRFRPYRHTAFLDSRIGLNKQKFRQTTSVNGLGLFHQSRIDFAIANPKIVA